MKTICENFSAHGIAPMTVTVKVSRRGVMPRRRLTPTRPADGTCWGQPRKLSIISSSLFSPWWPDRASQEGQSEFHGKFSEFIFRKVYHLYLFWKKKLIARCKMIAVRKFETKLIVLFPSYRKNNWQTCFSTNVSSSTTRVREVPCLVKANWP